MMADFCEFSGVIASGDDAVSALPKRWRCPKCGKRLKPSVDTCTGDFKMYCCIWATVPRHKKPVGGKKFLKKQK